MQHMHLTPAQYVIQAFKGVRATARAIGRTPPAVSKWKRLVDEDGNQGYIPQKAHRKILAAAARMNLSITPNDLIFGHEVEDEDE